MLDQRVEFDFEITFTNGGGLQGQAFRLDVPDADVTDAWIADALVRDLRLLMVADVRITNRRDIQETHKRGSGAAEPDGAASAARRLVDLSHPIEDGMTTYPGLPVPEIQPFLTRETSVERYAPGVTFAIDVLACPRCDGRMRVLAYISDPDVTAKVLDHLGLPSAPPRLAPPRDPPQLAFAG